MVGFRTLAAAGTLTLTLALAGAPSAWAQTGPVIVVPSRPGVPVIIDGRDATYAIVEGDWGLARPGHVAPTIYGGRSYYRDYGPRRRYYPADGVAPATGRNERDDDRGIEPAESYSRRWSTPAPSRQAPPPPAYPGFPFDPSAGGGYGMPSAQQQQQEAYQDRARRERRSDRRRRRGRD